MGKGALVAGSLALGVTGGVLGSLLITSSSTAPVASPVSTDRADLERLERRVSELAAKVGAPALVSTPGALAATPARDAGVESAVPAAATVDSLEALEKRVAALESRGSGGTPVPADLSKLPVAQLEALIRNLTAERRSGDAIRIAEEMLRRGDLTPAQRVEAEMNIGYGLRSQGKNAEAEARFRETLARVGDDSESAPWLGFQIGWERSFQKDLQGATAEMERAANHAHAQPLVRAHALYNAASFSRQAGDMAKAQVFLERLLGQHADAIPPSQAHMKAQAEAWLKEIRGS
jgi:BMFP domain-containing protein YqiC